MADISARQNESANIRRLSAQRHLYSRAKRFSVAQTILAGGTPLAAAALVALSPESAIWAALAGILVPILDITALDPAQKKLRESAARIQEEFDCTVLQIPWNEAVIGSRPSPEDIHEAAAKYVPSAKAPIENWYPAAVDDLPIHQARIVCQRTNCWWDAKLRRRYALSVLVALAAISLTVFLLGLYNGMTLEKFVLAVLAPLSPALLWGAREVQRQNETAAALDRLKDYGRSVWERLSAHTITQVEADALSRELQTAIFFRRCENPFVLDWIYNRLRNEYEEQMNAGAQAMLEEIQG